MSKSKTSGRKRIKFQIKANPGSDVYLAGSFNNWDPTAKKMTDSTNKGVYSSTLLLHAGEYEYKFIINNEWHVDPACPNWVRNDHGTLNSVLKI